MAPALAALVTAASSALKAGRHDEACTLLAQAAGHEAAEPDLLQMAAVLHCACKRERLALPWLERAHAQAPDRPDVLANLARARYRCGLHETALEAYAELECRGAASQAERLDMVAILAAMGQHEEAVAIACSLVLQDPHCAPAWLAWGNALDALCLYPAALFAQDRALSLDPTLVPALVGKGAVLHHLERYEEALEVIQQALAHDSSNGQAWANCAGILMRLKRNAAALECCEQALKHLPAPSPEDLRRAQAHPESLSWLAVLMYQAHLLRLCSRNEECALAYARLSALLPDFPLLRSMLLFMRRCICDWQDDAALLEQVRQSIANDDGAHSPFVIMGVIDDPWLQKRAIEKVGRQHKRSLPPLAQAGVGKRVRLAYLSADFHQHATAFLMNRFFAQHDRARFEVLGVSLASGSGDETTARLRTQFDEFIEPGHLPDAELARQLRARGIDIAIDLKGYTHDARPGVFAQRIAPVQVNWLGFPATTGMQDIDVILADRHVIPAQYRDCYTEQVAWVDGCYQCNDDERVIAHPPPDRLSLGLPEQGFVYCCHNALWKLTPAMFACWMRILGRVPGSVLWLLGDDELAMRNLRHAAKEQGIEPARLVFAQRAAHASHLARLSQADLFLDTLPCNAHTTASDALWAGLPLLTCTGKTFAGRVATSLLHASGLPELVCTSMQDYERRAVALATRENAVLQNLRQRLRDTRKGSVLFNTTASCRDVERVYLRLLQQRGLLAAPPALAA